MNVRNLDISVILCEVYRAVMVVMEQARSILQTAFGLSQFRIGQEEIINSILSGQDTLAVMPTGGGKSLCYQLPALTRKGITLVISPLIALMRDQVVALREKGLPAGCIHSGQTSAENAHVFREMRVHDSYLLYLSPERIQNPGFAPWLQTAPISLMAIDEAHCVSQWGHDFREDYCKLNMIRQLRPNIPILATTATATPQVLMDIQKQLDLKNPKRHVYGFYRPNLYYQVEFCDDDDDKYLLVEQALKQTPQGRIILYAGTRKKCEELSHILKKSFAKVGFYHAGLTSDERDVMQDQYEKGEVRILVATNAFGMGVDNPDVRLVIHYQMPANLESYYQEVGRAGRDGQNSTCMMLYSKRDKGLQSYFIRESKAPPAIINNKWRSLDAIIQFCEGGECRHAGILTYFRDAQRIQSCGHCDVCDETSPRKIMAQKSKIQTVTRKAKEKVKKILKNLDQTPLTASESALMAAIKAWRKDYARTNDMPAFIVFSDKTLYDLVKKKPNTLEGLKKVYGLGTQKVEMFGEELLRQLNG